MEKKGLLGIMFLLFSITIPIVSSFVYQQQTQNISQAIINTPYFYVDNNTSDMDSIPDKGTHSNFPAQQTAPNSIYDTLTEENTGAGGGIIDDYVDQTSDVDSSADLGTHDVFADLQASDNTYNNISEAGNGASGGTFAHGVGVGDETETSSAVLYFAYHGDSSACSFTDAGLVTSIYIDISTDGAGALAFYLGTVSGTTFTFKDYDPIATISPSSTGWQEFTAPSDFTAFEVEAGDVLAMYPTSGTALIGRSTSGSYQQYGYNEDDPPYSSSKTVTVSGTSRRMEIYVTADPISSDYQMDLEVQFTDVINFTSVEKVCIKTGTFVGSENINVSIWSDGSTWVQIYSDLTASTWNNYTLSGINSTTFTIKFGGSTTSSDTIDDGWEIDSVILQYSGTGAHAETIEDYVDNESSDMDSVSDLGDLTDFVNLTINDANYANFSETGGSSTISKTGTDTSGTGTTTTLQWSHTLVSGNDRIVIIFIGWENNGACTVTGVTYGGETCTEVIQSNTGGASYQNGAAIYYIDEDTLPSDGANQISVTFSAASTAEFNGYAMEFTGVSSSGVADYDETSEATPSDDTIENTGLTASAGDLLVSVVDCGGVGSFTHGQSQNERIDFGDGSSTFSATDLIASGSVTQTDSTYATGANRLSRMGAQWSPATGDYVFDYEVQFTNVIDFLATEKLCIYAGGFGGSEGLNVTYWGGSSWVSIASDLTASSWNNYTVSLTSPTFTIKFGGSVTLNDLEEDYWLIDAILLQVSGVGSEEDYVDNNTSEVDGSADKGTHSNFSAQQSGPDSVYDTLTEENTGSGASNTTLIDAESFEGSWPPTGWTETNNWNRESSYAYDGIYSADFDGSFGSPSGYLTSPSIDCSDATAIYVDFWWYDNSLDYDDFELEYYDGSSWDNYQDLNQLESWSGWHHFTEELTDSQYFVSNFRIRWWANSIGSGETGCVDLVTITKEVSDVNYELDLEVQFIDVVYSLPNGNLSIYGGTMGVEDIKVDVWNGTGWETVFSDLSVGWNNVSITDWLTISDLTIRFKGGTEIDDSSQDTWQIDVALLHVWNDAGENYELDLEVQWTNVDYSETNEELCIYGGTMGVEDIVVDVWNGTGWETVFTDLINGWNNVTVSSYLTSSTFTVRFKGSTETIDATQDNWDIDTTLLYTWS